jgi:large subunit ribosomal protein L10
MKKEDKEKVVADLTERLKASDTVLVADYRGLTMPQIDSLRGRLLESGARFSVVKNTLTRRAAEAAGADALLALLEGPSAVAFIEADGDMVAAAKALADSARETRILAIKGGVLQGRTVSAAEVESLATLPPADVLRGQVLGAIVAPIQVFAGLIAAPLQNLIGLIDARIEQLESQGGGTAATEEPASTEEAPTGDAAQAAAPAEPEAEAAEPTQEDATASDSEKQEESN